MKRLAGITGLLLASLQGSVAQSETGGRVCEANVRATDDIVFDPAEVRVARDCRSLKITFRHAGTVLKHNFVLVRKADMEKSRSDGEAAGEATGYLPKGKGQVLAHTALLEPGATETIEVPVATLKKSGPYGFYCSFPGHGATMKGLVRVADK